MQRRALLATVAVTGLSACGFRLRGAVRTPSFALLISGRPAGTGMALMARLRAAGTSVWFSGDPKAPATVNHILVIESDTRQRVVQGSNTSGLVRELKLKLNFSWRLVNAQDMELLAPQSLSYEQDMSFNESAALGKAEEENSLFEAMQERAVQATIARLARVQG